MKEEHPKSLSEISDQIEVRVVPSFLPDNSNLESDIFAFSYTVTLRNNSTFPVKLEERHWFIESGGELYTEVKGQGVVGQKPLIEPGASFQYTSWSVVQHPVGAMYGKYKFVNTKTAENFDVPIPRFELLCNEQVH